MFIFKRKPILPDSNLDILKSEVGRTVELMLIDKEETILFMKRYDLILIFCWENEYINGSLYQYSTFTVCQNGLSNIRNIPLYEVKRYFRNSDDSIVYIDDDTLKKLSKQNQQVFYALSELLNTFEIDAHSSKVYKCIW
ncbi:hypothetical protein [Planomicrobium sp. Y74]|uniref:hypothetical protein n=1 Tax=Planomicrobium sp. Y74 TaxID=2478977 RepID=UPI000EF46031|nr:hypothetical protein [Planomicrobium sp. Y74]RLQ90137.1 hypothetical protein D9754_10385 [Planomicrobium sp. Y74]